MGSSGGTASTLEATIRSMGSSGAEVLLRDAPLERRRFFFLWCLFPPEDKGEGRESASPSSGSSSRSTASRDLASPTRSSPVSFWNFLRGDFLGAPPDDDASSDSDSQS